MTKGSGGGASILGRPLKISHYQHLSLILFLNIKLCLFEIPSQQIWQINMLTSCDLMAITDIFQTSKRIFHPHTSDFATHEGCRKVRKRAK